METDVRVRGKMDNEKCIELIKLYENQRHLWDPTSPHHYNKQLKEDSWKIISKEMKLPISEVKKKITSLCGSFRREKSRHKKSLVTGSGKNSLVFENLLYISCHLFYIHFTHVCSVPLKIKYFFYSSS